MNIFKKIGFLSFLCLSSVSFAGATTILSESDIIRNYQSQLWNNAKARNDLQKQTSSLRESIDYCNSQIASYNSRLNFYKNKRVELDGKLAYLVCAEDLGKDKYVEKSRLREEINKNEYEIQNCEMMLNNEISKKSSLEYQLSQATLSLQRL